MRDLIMIWMIGPKERGENWFNLSYVFNLTQWRCCFPVLGHDKNAPKVLSHCICEKGWGAKVCPSCQAVS